MEKSKIPWFLILQTEFCRKRCAEKNTGYSKIFLSDLPTVTKIPTIIWLDIEKEFR
jgi:hypothetical protein